MSRTRSQWPTEPKVTAAATVAGLLGALATIATALLESGIELPAWAVAAVTTVLAVAGAFGAGRTAQHQYRDAEDQGRTADLPS